MKTICAQKYRKREYYTGEERVRNNPNFRRYKDTNYYFSVFGDVAKEYIKKDLKVKTFFKDGKWFFNFYGKPQKLCRYLYETFYGQIPADHYVVHRNGIKTDNNIKNLMLLSHHEMSVFAGRSQRRKPIINLVTKEVYRDKYACAKAVGYAPDYVRKICNKQVTTAIVELAYYDEEI